MSGLSAGIEHGTRLPRGRHGLPEAVVSANQRNRLLAATTGLFAEQGYSTLIVSEVIARAGVSRATFYQLFDDKQDCVLAAQRQALDSLRKLISAACASQPDWPMGVSAAVGSALEFAAVSPGGARLALASSYALAEPGLAGSGPAADQLLLELLDEGAGRCPLASEPDGLASQAAVGAAMSLVGSCLSAGDVDALYALKPELVQIILAPYVGAAEAARVSELAVAA